MISPGYSVLLANLTRKSLENIPHYIIYICLFNNSPEVCLGDDLIKSRSFVQNFVRLTKTQNIHIISGITIFQFPTKDFYVILWISLLITLPKKYLREKVIDSGFCKGEWSSSTGYQFLKRTTEDDKGYLTLRNENSYKDDHNCKTFHITVIAIDEKLGILKTHKIGIKNVKLVW